MTADIVKMDLEAAVIRCDECFVEPMEWMGPLEEDTGVLRCPDKKCGAELGSWSWNGRRWVVRARSMLLVPFVRLLLGSCAPALTIA